MIFLKKLITCVSTVPGLKISRRRPDRVIRQVSSRKVATSATDSYINVLLHNEISTFGYFSIKFIENKYLILYATSDVRFSETLNRGKKWEKWGETNI
jgi:hypothetical protein